MNGESKRFALFALICVHSRPDLVFYSCPFVCIRGLIFSKLKHHHRLSEVDLVACFQTGSAGIAVDFDAGSLANNAEGAIGAALVPAVVEYAILAGFSVVIDMRVLA